MIEEIKTRAKTKLPDLLCDELKQPKEDFRCLDKTRPWAVESRSLGLCVMCILGEDEDEAFNSFLTHRFLKPVPIQLVENSFEVRFGYIVFSSDSVFVEDGKLIIKKG